MAEDLWVCLFRSYFSLGHSMNGAWALHWVGLNSSMPYEVWQGVPPMNGTELCGGVGRTALPRPACLVRVHYWSMVLYPFACLAKVHHWSIVLQLDRAWLGSSGISLANQGAALKHGTRSLHLASWSSGLLGLCGCLGCTPKLWCQDLVLV